MALYQSYTLTNAACWTEQTISVEEFAIQDTVDVKYNTITLVRVDINRSQKKIEVSVIVSSFKIW